MQSIKSHITITDAITWQAARYTSNAVDPHQMATAKANTLKLLCIIPDEMLQTLYLETICRQYKWKLTDTKKQFTQIQQQHLPKKQAAIVNDEEDYEDYTKFPKWAEPYLNQWKENGFIQSTTKKHIGIYYINKNYNAEQSQTTYSVEEFSNFICTPIMLVYKRGGDSTFILEIQNHNRNRTIEVSAGSITSPELFIKMAVSEGNFMIHGGAAKWKRVVSHLLENFKIVQPIEHLGWQPHGFYAFVNGAIIPGTPFTPLDDNGLLQYEDTSFLIPASSKVYGNISTGEEDVYQNERALIFNTTPPATVPNFSTWANIMYAVYGNKGLTAIAAVCMALFRDIVFSIDNNCPMLWAYGEPGGGKSKFVESLYAVFYKGRKAFNVNSGKDFAFFEYMAMFTNALAWVNEVDESTIKIEWLHALKGVYDGESRQKGSINGSRLHVKTQKIESLVMLSGQKIITADDNALVSRCLIEEFAKQSYTQQQEQQFQTLKIAESEGLSHILADVIKHRMLWQNEYRDVLNDILSHWRRNKPQSRQCSNRILLNWAQAAANYTILATQLQLPVKEEDFKQYCLDKAIQWSQFISTSDALSEFWATIQNLVNTKQITEGWDYKISHEKTITIEGTQQQLTDPTPILFLRMNNIHPLYEKDSRQRGKQSISIPNIMQYLSNRPYFLGSVRSHRFHKFEDQASVKAAGSIGAGQAFNQFVKKEGVYSCHAFIYPKLNIEITSAEEDSVTPF
jgi:hypothetical protein